MIVACWFSAITDSLWPLYADWRRPRISHRIRISRHIGGPGYVGRSRWVNELWRHPPLDRDHAFVEALRVFLEARPEVRFVFPVGDTEIRALERMRSRLPPQVHYLMASTSVLQTCRRKASLFAISRELGIPTAEYRLATTGQALLEAADAVGYPCVVKAETEELRAFGRKAFIVTGRAQLQEALEPAAAATSVARAVSTFPGLDTISTSLPRLEWYAQSRRSRSSEPIAVMERGMRSRASPSQRTCSGATISQDSHRICGYDGPGCLQFIHDGVSRSTILEMNPRLGANYAIVEKAGSSSTPLVVGASRMRSCIDPCDVGVRIRTTLRMVLRRSRGLDFLTPRSRVQRCANGSSGVRHWSVLSPHRIMWYGIGGIRFQCSIYTARCSSAIRISREA